ncbi:MAG: signal peptidase I [Proteobacteria bacterium]|nr:signal peptidase I [Pseudomonadota bacterium]
MSFPLILVVLTGVSGLLWLLEIIWLRPRRAEADRDRQSAVTEYAISFFPVLLFVLVLRSFLVEPFQIPSGSMKPTLQVGDFILVNKFSYGIRLPVIGTKVFDIGEPQRGDAMVFIPPHQNQYFIKRVIGLPGDRIRYQNKVLYINNVEQTQQYKGPVTGVASDQLSFIETLDNRAHMIQRNRYEDARVQQWLVPEGHYFMMGDNRDQSSDSRFWGFVSEDKIVGEAFAVWLHKEPGLSMPSFERNRWID